MKTQVGIDTVDRGTSETLLQRLRDVGDQQAWERFYGMYSPLVVSFCLDRGCDREMAWEVLQETLVCLMRALPRFVYRQRGGSFRSFLLRIVHARIADAFRRERRQRRLFGDGSDSDVVERAEDTSTVHPGDAWDRGWRKMLLVQAIERVRLRVEEKTFRSFEMFVLQGRPPAAVAEELGIKRNAVYQHKARLVELLRREVEALTQEFGDSR